MKHGRILYHILLINWPHPIIEYGGLNCNSGKMDFQSYYSGLKYFLVEFFLSMVKQLFVLLLST